MSPSGRRISSLVQEAEKTSRFSIASVVPQTHHPHDRVIVSVDYRLKSNQLVWSSFREHPRDASTCSSTNEAPPAVGASNEYVLAMLSADGIVLPSTAAIGNDDSVYQPRRLSARVYGPPFLYKRIGMRFNGLARMPLQTSAGRSLKPVGGSLKVDRGVDSNATAWGQSGSTSRGGALLNLEYNFRMDSRGFL
jgi:hypothetical protein